MNISRAFSIIGLAAVASAIVAARPAPHHLRSFDLAQSKMTVYVYKQGLFAFAADNHVINAPIAAGTYDQDTKKVALRVDAAKMRVLDPQMPSGRRDRVQANMVGPDVLDAGRYPTISFRSTATDPTSGGQLKVSGKLTLHGQTHPVSLRVAKLSASHFTGSTTLKQTDFGITPIRIAGGAVRVKDEVKITFDVVLK
jgi:polyisoprenoid-binding protein YceI